MIQPNDELGQIDFTTEIHQLDEHALNPTLARRALQFDSTNQLSHKSPLHSTAKTLTFDLIRLV